MEISFTIIIDSNKKKSGNTNDCFIEINTPQSNGKKINCEVLLFSISFPSNNPPAVSYIKLISNDLNIYDQYSNQNILSIYDNRNYRYSRTVFNAYNFNSRLLNFKLLSETDSLLLNSNNENFNYPWILILKCTII